MYKIILIVGLMVMSVNAGGFLKLESQKGDSMVLPKGQLICILSKYETKGTGSYEIAIYIKDSLSIFPKNTNGTFLKDASGQLSSISIGTKFIPYKFHFDIKDNKYILRSGIGFFRSSDGPSDQQNHYKFQHIKLKNVVSQLIALGLIPEVPPFSRSKK
jgi:hypothetical protein